jgi:hypothetical protein
MEFMMKILVPNETLKGFHLPFKYNDNPHDQWNCNIHHFPYFGHLDGVFELHHF